MVITQDGQEAVWNYSLLVNSVPVESRFPLLGSLLDSVFAAGTFCSLLNGPGVWDLTGCSQVCREITE